MIIFCKAHNIFQFTKIISELNAKVKGSGTCANYIPKNNILRLPILR